MKILQLTNKPPYPDKDGGAIATLNLTRGLARNGHEVTVLFMYTLKHAVKIGEIPPEVRNLADFRDVFVPAAISAPAALANLLFSGQPYNAVRFISGDYSEALKKLLLEKKFDIIQLEGLYLCPYIPLIRKYSEALIAYRAHNVEHEIWERTMALTAGFKKFYIRNLAARIRKFELKWLNHYDLLVPITERDGNILNRLGNLKPVHVSPTGINKETMKSGRTTIEFPSLFHLGSLEWAPNQEGLLWFLHQCWPKIRERFPDLKFYIAGRNAPGWLIARFNLPGVVFEGEVADAYTFMDSRAIMAVPLLSGSGMRIKIIEGMAMGKAIVSTSTGAEGIGTTHNKNIMIADTPEEFTDAICRLVTGRELFNSLSRESILFIHENFDNLAIAGKLAGFYKNSLT
jgi:glycosyltransferase involved in cell wall biosynthesis